MDYGQQHSWALGHRRCSLQEEEKNDHYHDHGYKQNEEEYDGYNDVNDIMIMIRAEKTKETGQNGHRSGM